MHVSIKICVSHFGESSFLLFFGIIWDMRDAYFTSTFTPEIFDKIGADRYSENSK